VAINRKENTMEIYPSYQIRVKGQMDERWMRWFEDFTVLPQPDGDTLISGTSIDQAALFGVLNRIRDLGLELVSVQRTLSNVD
jgi:hypothetical protein